MEYLWVNESNMGDNTLKFLCSRIEFPLRRSSFTSKWCGESSDYSFISILLPLLGESHRFWFIGMHFRGILHVNESYGPFELCEFLFTLPWPMANWFSIFSPAESTGQRQSYLAVSFRSLSNTLDLIAVELWLNSIISAAPCIWHSFNPIQSVSVIFGICLGKSSPSSFEWSLSWNAMPNHAM